MHHDGSFESCSFLLSNILNQYRSQDWLYAIYGWCMWWGLDFFSFMCTLYEYMPLKLTEHLGRVAMVASWFISGVKQELQYIHIYIYIFVVVQVKSTTIICYKKEKVSLPFLSTTIEKSASWLLDAACCCTDLRGLPYDTKKIVQL